ncbi:DNA polymerase zeta catalytic subunit [Armadillidium nasatum]|uniref:DNA polymerase n=1 Tax=Armadillidium nasatum TaxID=96803 RepID=A0A5N5TIQ2_9CRUS|nr:DNA polymerase zeta catalytic subunit [Armadillidium nasatum]
MADTQKCISTYGNRLKEKISELLDQKRKYLHNKQEMNNETSTKHLNKTNETTEFKLKSLSKTYVDLFGSSKEVSQHSKMFASNSADDDEEYIPYPVSQVKDLPRLSPPPQSLNIEIESDEEYMPEPIVSSQDSKPEYIPTKIEDIGFKPTKYGVSCDAYVPQPVFDHSDHSKKKDSSNNCKKSKGEDSSSSGESEKSKKFLHDKTFSQSSSTKGNFEKKDDKEKSNKKGNKRRNDFSNIFNSSVKKSVLYKYEIPPPTIEEISLSGLEIGESTLPPAFCSNIEDIPSKPLEVGGHVLKLSSNLMEDLKEFEGRFQSDGIQNWKVLLRTMRLEINTKVSFSGTNYVKEKKSKLLTPLKPPPSPEKCKEWISLWKKSHGNDKDDDYEDNKKLSGTNSEGRSFSSGSTSILDKNSQPNSNSQSSTSSSNGKKNRSTLTLSETPITKSVLKTSTPFPSKNKQCKKKRRISWDDEVKLSLEEDELSENISQELFTDVPEEEERTIHDSSVLSQNVSGKKVVRTSPSVSVDYLKELSKNQRRSKRAKKLLTDFKRQKTLSPILEPKSSSKTLVDNSSQGSPSSQIENVKETFRVETSLDCSSSSTQKRNYYNSQFRKQFYSPSPHHSLSEEISGPSFNTTYGFKIENHNLQEAKSVHKYEYLTVMCVECHVTSRPSLLPDPKVDPISALIFSITQDAPEDHPTLKQQSVRAQADLLAHSGVNSISSLFVNSEVDLLEEIIRLVHHWDPDILVGYEVQMSSWGYLLERGTTLIENIVSRLSRVPDSKDSHFQEEKDEYGAEHTHQIHIIGRIILNVWRLMRAEVTLTSYSLENVAYHVLHVRIPSFSYDLLTKWWTSDKQRFRTLEHYIRKCNLTVELLQRLDLITRTSELARLFGLQFYEVLSRGSQLRVESMMLRLSRGENMVAISPSINQRGTMKAPEWLPLIMEPESRYYTDPVIVLDFQSLYPSMIIAYNYCFSTCLGRVSFLGSSEDPFNFGASQLKVSPEYLASIIDQINISPCGIAFVQPSIRKGVLPKMLEEILNTRIMVKTAMKAHKDIESLQRVLHSRQLGLKLIANVTYGYTSANFSGRMPCVEIADSVVSKGRETLERAITLVNSRKEWGGRVVYGDTDSLFVHLPNKSKEEAFKIGKIIAKEVTQRNPKPVKLKFEKVYLPCILQTKKRYVGYMYESEDQKEPVFDAKGIETVRRDGCPAIVKILEKSLKILFNSSDVSLVKSFVQRQMTKIMQGKVNIQDLTFAKEYRGMKGYRPSACVPALELTRFQDLPRSSVPSLLNSRNTEQEKTFSITRFFSTSTCAACGQTIKDKLVQDINSRRHLCDTCVSSPQKTILALTSKINNYERGCGSYIKEKLKYVN